MRKSIELRNELGTVTNEYRLVLNKIDTEKRKTPNTEEKAAFAKMDARMDELGELIAMHEKQEAREAGVPQIDNSRRRPEPGTENANGRKPFNEVRASAGECAGVEPLP